MSPNPADACAEMTAVAYASGEDGKLTLRVNEVTLLRDHVGGMTGFVPPSLLLEGDNTLTIQLTGEGGAKAEVFKGCMGEFPKDPGENENVLGSVTLTAAGSKTVTFAQSGLPAYSYLAAAPTDETGLREAIAAFIDTARNRDVEGYLAYLEPMLHDFALDDPQAPEMLREMATYVIGGPFEVVDPGALTVTPVLGGRAYQVTDSAGKPPLQFAMPGDSGESSDELNQAGIWMKTAAGWKVLRH